MSNSLVDEINAASIIGEIIALRAYDEKSILLVEGPSDARFFAGFVSYGKCDVVISHGRDLSIEVIRQISGVHAGVLAVIDQDLDALFDGSPIHKNIIVTDDTDIEVMMVRSAAFDSLIWELGSVQKLRELATAGFDPRKLILKAARRVFILKFMSRKENMGLKFRELRLSFVDGSLEYDTEEMVTAVFNHSQKSRKNMEKIVAAIEELERSDLDQWVICSGHVLCGFIGKALQRLIGSLNSSAAKAEEIESRLRTAFSNWDLKLTALYSRIREWEARNIPYIILKAEF